MLSAAGDGECEAGLAQTAAPATCTASGSQRVAWSSSRVRSGVLLLVTHARRAPRLAAAAPEVGGGGGSAKRRAASGGGSERQSKSVSRRDWGDSRQEGGRREERGL